MSRAEWRAERRRSETENAQPTNSESWPHEAPDQPLSVTEAHRTVQRHREWRADGCLRKAAAWNVLVESGNIEPDTGRQV
ncbi:hypothetical protein ACQP1G_35485 [Nocardia sp. CA-107356]|uniref:hypothetical protein n=1 Tax=Nocardia sp. CA-107356 TaxID=3239972 RepID=UPI003D8E6AE6